MREQQIRSLLLLDASADERRLVSAIASRAGWTAVGVGDGEAASGYLQGPHGREVHAALLGSWNSESGPALIASLREQRPTLPVIVLSNGSSVADAVEAMQAGASDFLVRPVAQERLLEALAANADRRKAAGELAPVSEKLAPSLSLEQLVGAAPEFRAALAVAAKAARNRLPILIIGEPGTGKETLARAIHAASLRAKGPLLALDCKAIPANIIDSELFGHEKGAFPGAFAAKTGRLVQSDGGTLLLDDIAALPADTQETLDRVLATGEVRPVRNRRAGARPVGRTEHRGRGVGKHRGALRAPRRSRDVRVSGPVPWVFRAGPSRGRKRRWPQIGAWNMKGPHRGAHGSEGWAELHAYGCEVCVM